MEEITKKIMEMMAELQPYAEVDETTDLLGEDVLDSVSVLALVQELEETFDIEIMAEEITAHNFKDVRSIASMIKKK